MLEKTYFEKQKEAREFEAFISSYFTWLKYIIFIFAFIYLFFIGYIHHFSIMIARVVLHSFVFFLMGLLPLFVFSLIIIKPARITIFLRMSAMLCYSLVFFVWYSLSPDLKYVYKNYKYYQTHNMTIGLVDDVVKFEPKVFEHGHGRTVVVEDIPYILSLGNNQKATLMCRIGKNYLMPRCPLVSDPNYIHKQHHIRYKVIETDKVPMKLLIEVVGDKTYTQDFFIHRYKKQLQEVLTVLIFFIIIWLAGCFRLATYQKQE